MTTVTQRAPQAQQAPQPQQNPNALAVIRKETVDVVAEKVRQFQQKGELALPTNYSAENAMKSAWLILQAAVDKDKRPVLQVCTRESIMNALLDMVVQGLNPAKKQCYFLPYGQTLSCQRSYFGDMALVNRVRPDTDIYYDVVYQGDEFEYQMERGRRRVTKHVQRIENIKPEGILAAYCVIEGKDGEIIHTEIMTVEQIKRSWQQSRQYNPSGGNTPHHTFPDQMCLRTVIRRACKAVINASSDDYLLLEHVNRSEGDTAEAEIDADAAAHANGDIIDIEPGETEIADEPTQEPTPAAPQPATSTRPAPSAGGPGF